MLRTFETIKRSSFYKPQLAVNFLSHSASANASAELGANAQLSFTLFSTSFHSRAKASADWNLYTKFSRRDSNPRLTASVE